MDLGTALGYWIEPDDPPVFQVTVFGPTNRAGNLTRVEFAERWSRATGRDASNVLFYYAFALFKLAVVAQQLYKRWVDGLTKEERYADDDRGRPRGRDERARRRRQGPHRSPRRLAARLSSSAARAAGGRPSGRGGRTSSRRGRPIMKTRWRTAPPTKPPTCAMKATPPRAEFVKRVPQVDDEELADDEPRREDEEEAAEEPQEEIGLKTVIGERG